MDDNPPHNGDPASAREDPMMAVIGHDADDRRRRETQHYHRLALDLAERCEDYANLCPWPIASSKLRQAASSLRWQVTWERKFPSQAYTPAADRAEREES